MRAFLLLSLWLVGCDSLTPSDEPLPEPATVLGLFDAPPPGRGTFCQGEVRGCSRRAVDTEATHSRLGTLPAFERTQILLIGTGTRARIEINQPVDSLVAGQRYPASGGLAYAGSGRGWVWFTTVSADRLAGVFAMDYEGSTLYYPIYDRAIGAFNATFSDEAP